MSDGILCNMDSLAQTRMRQWRQTVSRVAWGIVAAFALATMAGYMARGHAQQQNRQSQATQIAVDENRLTTVEAAESRITTRLDEQGVKLDGMRDTLANMQGMGVGAMALVTVINLLGIGIQLKNRKPS